MSEEKPLPRSLKIVAGLFIAAGVWSAGVLVVGLAQGELMLDAKLVFPVIGYGLLRRRRWGRTCALVVAWLYALAAPATVAVGYLWSPEFEVGVLGWTLAPYSVAGVAAVIAFVLLVLLAAGWAIRVVRRADVRHVFAT